MLLTTRSTHGEMGLLVVLTVLFGRADRDDEIGAGSIAGVAHVVQIAGAAEAYVSRFHAACDAVGGEFADTFSDQPDLVVQMFVGGFVKSSDLLVGLVHLDLDIACLEHSGEISLRCALGL